MVDKNTNTNTNTDVVVIDTIDHLPDQYGLTQEQVMMLSKPLDMSLIRHVNKGGMQAYITAKTAIEHANDIFGFGGWGYKVVARSFEQAANGALFYTCDIELSVLGVPFTFPGEGIGEVIPLKSGECTVNCYEKARKESVTDALKRGLRHYGKQFGLSLYDKDEMVEDEYGSMVPVRDVPIHLAGSAPASTKPAQPRTIVEGSSAPAMPPPPSPVPPSGTKAPAPSPAVSVAPVTPVAPLVPVPKMTAAPVTTPIVALTEDSIGILQSWYRVFTRSLERTDFFKMLGITPDQASWTNAIAASPIDDKYKEWASGTILPEQQKTLTDLLNQMKLFAAAHVFLKQEYGAGSVPELKREQAMEFLTLCYTVKAYAYLCWTGEADPRFKHLTDGAFPGITSIFDLYREQGVTSEEQVRNTGYRKDYHQYIVQRCTIAKLQDKLSDRDLVKYVGILNAFRKECSQEPLPIPTSTMKKAA